MPRLYDIKFGLGQIGISTSTGFTFQMPDSIAVRIGQTWFDSISGRHYFPSQTILSLLLCFDAGHDENFVKMSNAVIDSKDVEYDYSSVMQYSSFAGTIGDGAMTVTKLNDSKITEYQVCHLVLLNDSPRTSRSISQTRSRWQDGGIQWSRYVNELCPPTDDYSSKSLK